MPSYSASSKKIKVLIVDDESLIRIGLEKFVTKEGFTAITASSAHKALELVKEHEPDVALLDLKLNDTIDGLDLLEEIKESRPHIVCMMISGQSEIHSAVEAMKLGARDYLEKPIDFNYLRSALVAISQDLESTEQPEVAEEGEIAITNQKMKKVVSIAKRLALKSDLTILILGESGTGKNYLCQKIHNISSRQNATYIQIGCANIPDHLIESELFGYEKGAFTDAKASKKGLIEAAEGGTVLLDELGDMPYQFQTKILKLLEDRSFRRIGALHDTSVNVRVLAATNRDLKQQVEDKKFRLDLYYRLNIATIEIPPLRECQEDIPIMTEHFLTTFCQKYDVPDKTISQDALNLLTNYAWPGNIRELKNLLEKLVVLSDGDMITSEDITDNLDMSTKVSPPTQKNNTAQPGVDDTTALPADLSLEAMEERFIREALKKTGGNQRKAAKLLNISRDALRYRLKKMDLPPEDDD